jgi:predicted nucleic acid-binding protein
MSDKYFVDTNILMYAHDAASGEKHEKAKALVEKLWETRSGAVSTQVLQELAVNLRRKARRSLDARSTRDRRVRLPGVAGGRERGRLHPGSVGHRSEQGKRRDVDSRTAPVRRILVR